jgi:UDP-GlcNAc:undecaprenyl-phosphate/decaprenyl-phosphate GlcNAc-1-phosphate transferase
LVVFTRLREGRSPAQAGKDHTSHRLAFAGFDTRRAVMLCYAGCLFVGGAALVISRVDVPTAGLVGIVVAVVAMMAFITLEVIRVRQHAAQPK